MRLALALCLAAGAAAAQDAAPTAETATAPSAALRGLDKVSGLSTDIDIAAGGTATFGRLEIAMSECRYPADDPTSDAFAHLTIRDTLSGGAVFDGWMIAASPALNALDHARYDVWVLRCTTPAAEGTSD